MKVASWNINSIRVRLSQLLEWLQKDSIDVLLLQEIKCLEEVFPKEHLEDAGFNVAVYGQKTYNGVAILSRFLIEDVVKGQEIFEGDPQARYIEAFINNHSFASVYVPNGVAPETEAYFYKLKFLRTLSEHIKGHSKFVIGGDFNIAITDLDVYNPRLWKDHICCTAAERESLTWFVKENSLKDCLREEHPGQEGLYSWWDYRTGGFAKDRGLRLDYLFASPDVSFSNSYVAKNMRGKEKPSDHAPVVMEID